MIEIGIYRLKEEFFKELGISEGQYRRRQSELLSWLKEFYDYVILENTKPLLIEIKEIYGEYQPLPRKTYNAEAREKLTQEKVEMYNAFVDSRFSSDNWILTSKMEEARIAIDDFGKEKFGHSNCKAVASRYISPAMNNVCEKSDEHYWVSYPDYNLLSDEEIQAWHDIMREEHISEREAANAFYRMSQGEDVTKEQNYYKRALDRFKAQYKFIPILVSKYRRKENK